MQTVTPKNGPSESALAAAPPLARTRSRTPKHKDPGHGTPPSTPPPKQKRAKAAVVTPEKPPSPALNPAVEALKNSVRDAHKKEMAQRLAQAVRVYKARNDKSNWVIAMVIPQDIWNDIKDIVQPLLYKHSKVLAGVWDAVLKKGFWDDPDRSYALLASVGIIVSPADQEMIATNAPTSTTQLTIGVQYMDDGTIRAYLQGWFFDDYKAQLDFCALGRKDGDFIVYVHARSLEELKLHFDHIEEAVKLRYTLPARTAAYWDKFPETAFYSVYAGNAPQPTILNGFFLRTALAFDPVQGGPMGGPFAYSDVSFKLRGTGNTDVDFEELEGLAKLAGVTLIDASS